MITVRYGGTTTELSQDQLVLWLAGFNSCDPHRGARFIIGNGAEVSFADEDDLAGERYVITIVGDRIELPADWVIPWASGLAAREGVDLSSLVADDHERARRMQALMVCHEFDLLTYIGIIERTKTQ